jgi:hypothetical protein
VKDQPKTIAIRHDPRASLVERLRVEEAAREAAAKSEMAPQPVTVAEPPASAVLPVALASTQSAPKPAAPTAAQPAPETSAPAALTGVPTQDEAARAVRATQEKMKAEKARKARLAARERAKVRAMQEASALRQQDQVSGYAPRPSFGPFGQQGGWGGGWNRGW